MQRQEVIKILKKDLNFSDESIIKLQKFSDLVLEIRGTETGTPLQPGKN